MTAPTMHAIRQHEFGGPDVLVHEEIPRPTAGPGEVLVRVRSIGVNFADTHTRENKYVQKAHLPLVPGQEVVGVREDSGERVVALTQGGGAYAEWAVVPEARCVPLPDGLPDDQALGLLVQGLTAWHLHRTCGRLEGGETVVVHSAAGGTGSLAVQLAKPLGAGRVIATASSAEKRQVALDLGADVAVDPDPEGLTERLGEANGGRGVDVVIDMSGGPVFEASLRALAPFGRIVVCGIAGKEQNEVRTGHLLRHSRSVIGFWLFHTLEDPERRFRAPLLDLFERAARGEVRVHVGGRWPLAEAGEAHRALVERRTTGKLVLDVG
ncbi:quinone oxidoreductase family protein [Patulibacter americanus]|uniref:quinone oxidoreductase family protein n=1 Tax=Patulibacter americanus TaxID=588672 RepID=UPI0003B6FFB6|nr:NADPH:quinone oxidoreductase family protein [Patulibacter americanus]